MNLYGDNVNLKKKCYKFIQNYKYFFYLINFVSFSYLSFHVVSFWEISIQINVFSLNLTECVE